MPNISVIDRLVGAPSPAQGSLIIPAFVPASGSAAVVTNQPGNAAILNVGGSQLLSPTTTVPSYPLNFGGFPFKVRVMGAATSKASCNVTIAIQVGNSTTVTAGNTVATTGAISYATVTSTFLLEAMMSWDNVSQKLSGCILPSYSNNSLVDIAALTNAVSVTSQASLQFVVVATFSDQTAGTQLVISEFVADTY